jgi:hypothetical protein
VRELCRYLNERREPIVQHAATKNAISKEEAGQQLDGVLGVLALLDRVELTQRSRDGQAVLTLRVRTVQPLR